MRVFLTVLVLLGSGLGAMEARAGAEPAAVSWKELFDKAFYSDYLKNACGGNILDLLREARRQGLSLQGAEVIHLKNSGSSVFGMLNVEWARESGGPNPEHPRRGPKFLPGERNWDFHVFLIHQGRVYDLDFGNEPAAPTVSEYLERMFLHEKPKGPLGTYFVGREKKLREYRATPIPAEEYLKREGAVDLKSGRAGVELGRLLTRSPSGL